ncbi:unnamed protein product [Caenorhabditis angaria]|uniref:NTF2-like domain-containing protein n=1 Tax=Caenorhabditis angaria TaxID=860376 RepID=A0A9P1IDF0_9PELO|nr:unnamed protein product [Caenorhabditis angaria]
MQILVFFTILTIFASINADFKEEITELVKEINKAVETEDHQKIAGFFEESASFHDCLANRRKEELVEFVEFGKIEFGRILAISEVDGSNSTFSLRTTTLFSEGDGEIEWILKKNEDGNGTSYRISKGHEICLGF